MSQHDMIIENDTGAAFRADLNSALQALVSSSGGTSAPTTPYAGQPWIDTTTATAWVLNFYDGTDWIPTIIFNTTANTVTYTGLVPGTDIAGLATVNLFSKAQRGSISTLTDAATIAVDAALNNHFTVTLGGNRTLGLPTNLVAGQGGSIFVIQDGTGSRTLAYNTVWEFVGGDVPILSTDAAAVDRIDYIVQSASSIHAVWSGALS